MTPTTQNSAVTLEGLAQRLDQLAQALGTLCVLVHPHIRWPTGVHRDLDALERDAATSLDRHRMQKALDEQRRDLARAEAELHPERKVS